MKSTIHDNLFFRIDCRSGDVPIDLPMKAKLKEIGMQKITSHLWFLSTH